MVEGARLESVCTGNCTEGSNPSLSANFILQNFSDSLGVAFLFCIINLLLDFNSIFFI